MGDRYLIEWKCPECGKMDEVYYAPTCDIIQHKCECGFVVDLEELTGISYADASNVDIIARHAAPAMAEKDAEIEDLITELERAAGKHLRNLSEIATLKAEVERLKVMLNQAGHIAESERMSNPKKLECIRQLCYGALEPPNDTK